MSAESCSVTVCALEDLDRRYKDTSRYHDLIQYCISVVLVSAAILYYYYYYYCSKQKL